MNPLRRPPPVAILVGLAVLVGGWLVGAAPAAAVPPPEVAAPGPPGERCPAAGSGSIGARLRAPVESVAVLVVFPGGDRRSACVEPGGTGIDVLRRAGFAPVVSSYGSVGGRVAVCALTHPGTGDQVGCASGPSCLTCRAPDYWGYFPGYRYSAVGAGTTTPSAGSVQAWRWGESTRWSGSSPSSATLCGTVEPPPPTTTSPRVPPSTQTTPPRVTTRPPGGGSTGTTEGPARPPSGGGDGGSGGNAGGGRGTGGGEAPGGGGTSGPSSSEGGRGGEAGPDPAPPGNASGTVAGEGAEEMSAHRSGDEQSASGPASPSGASPSGPGGGSATGPAALALTAGAVAVIAALALRARRRRAASDIGGDPPGQ